MHRKRWQCYDGVCRSAGSATAGARYGATVIVVHHPQPAMCVLRFIEVDKQIILILYCNVHYAEYLLFKYAIERHHHSH